jgi:hypothetical protein
VVDNGGFDFWGNPLSAGAPCIGAHELTVGGNNPPVFTSDPLSKPDATENAAYSDSIAGDATDADSDPLTFSVIAGPAWLNLAFNGVLSGTPGAGDVGANSWTVQVSDGNGGTDIATLNITVDAAPNQPPVFTADPINEIAATEDAAYSSTIADDAYDPESDPMTFSKVSGPAWLSVASDGTLSGTPSNSDVGLNVFTVQVDATGGSDTATLNITVDATGPVDDYANADLPVSGTVSGSYLDAQASNNGYEAITEVESGGKPSKRYSYLEHTWTVDVTGGSSVTFYVEAYKTANSEGDNFVFAYSTDNVNFTDMVTVSKTSDDNVAQSFVLPGSLSGTVYIRVKDTNQSQGNRSLDTVYIDEMYIRSE